MIPQPVLIKFGMQHPEETCYNFFLKFYPPHLKTVITVPFEIQKFFSNLQQYSDVRNDKVTAEKVSKAQSRFRFLQRRKDLHSYFPWTRKTIDCTLALWSEGVTLVPAVFSHTVIMSVTVSKIDCTQLVKHRTNEKKSAQRRRKHCARWL